MTKALTRDDYSKLYTVPILRVMLRRVRDRMSRCMNVEDMIADMFAEQEIAAALASKQEAA